MVVPPSDVFSKVEKVKELDTVNIAMTDYGFWDIEANQTNNTTYSYRGGKSYENTDVPNFNNDTTKLVDPTISFGGTTKYCEYSHVDDGEIAQHERDRLWKPVSANWYKCDGISGTDGNSKKYREAIVVNGKSLPFVGGTENFAVYNYNEDGNEPVHILANLSPEQFKNLLLSDAQLTNYFIVWLYEQVTHKPPTGGTTRGEWYLYNEYGKFIANLRSSLQPASGITYSGLQFQLGKTYETGINVPISTKFGRVVSPNSSTPSIVRAYKPTASTLAEYCTALNDIVNPNNVKTEDNPSGELDVNWLIDSGESSLI